MTVQNHKNQSGPVSFKAPAPLLPDYLSLHARWQADHPALITSDGSVSWADFDKATNRIANGLKKQGLGPGDHVAVVMNNGRAMMEALFGIMKAGCCSVPLNLSVSDDALAAMLDDSGAKGIFVTDQQRPRLDAIFQTAKRPALCVCADEAAAEWLSLSQWMGRFFDTSLALAIPPDAPCNIIYSSGTTGLPKGIVHSHQGRLHWAYDIALAYGYRAGAKSLCTIGLYSNIMWAVMLATLLGGGTVVVHDAFDAKQALDDIKRLRITHTAMVPVQWQRLVDAGADTLGLASLQSAITVGSPMPVDLKRRILALMPTAFFELYGLTEGILTVLAPDDMTNRLTSVGRPIPGCDIRLIDDEGHPCPHGEAGEIVSRARYVMPGYLNRPDATEESQWRDENGDVWLRTGDVGRLDDKGYLYIVDRKKDMILSGGQNIYPADIEAILLRHDAVSDCAVIGVPDDRWGETPIAIVVAAAAITAEDLQQWLNERLGKQQRVRAIVFADTLPRNPNGKILKRVLRTQHQKGRL
ncbi:4-coumarate--CoA ligase [Iodidimonas muriae]|uniref:4-coumarate--CoA ligase n=1 Tax=Iodidimonas muriae TaxID=261467 RepID=A0ABQ2LH57_9PROT|nr:class I adenylate-forming enzyme family protein [Iodidimonas muriae]GER08512.1 4-coumarate--CoA ligase [Kordiimonadales bacterium JCM 17843]GGO15274.1 4-coumarate--CoA ligase [Iodidimonas muriae]